MKKAFIFGMVLIVMMICVSAAAAQDTVTRDLPDSADANTTITVNLTVDVETTAGSLLIDEVVPSGWTVVSATNDGDYATLAGHIYWTKLSSVTDATYSYTLQIPADASGTYTFGGTYMFDTMTDYATISGDTELTVGVESPTPKLTSCVIDPTSPVAQGTNITVDCLFSETVVYEIRIENATGYLVEELGSGTAKNPDPKWWNTTTETPAGIYTVNVTMDNSTSGLSSYNNTNKIEVTPAGGDTTPPVITDVACDTPTTDSVNVTWTTNEDSDSLVKYGTVSGTYTAEVSDAAMTTSHSIMLTGLDADTDYYFVVNSTDASANSAESAESSFKTAIVVATQDTVTRDLPDSADADTTITVNLTVDVETTAGSLLIDEVVPSGWTVVSATNDGDYATLAGHIYWTKLSSVTDATYSYTLQIPADASGTYTFGGTYMFDTMTDYATISGDTEMTVGGVSTADTTPPNTAGHDPASGATGVPIDTSITVHVLDAVSGVNNSTIVMTVNGTIVTPDITGTTADYTIVYTPPEDFGYDQLVNVTINASDLNETPNVMTTDAYSFTTGSVPEPTSFVILDPADGTVGTPITVTVEVRDQYDDLVATYQDNVTLNASGSATGDGLVNIVNGIGSLDISDTVAETVTLSLNDTNETGLDVSSTQDVVFAARDNGGSGGSSSGSGTYPPGWGEPAPTSAATPAPTAAPEPTVAPTKAPTVAPTEAPTKAPTVAPTETTTTEMKTEGTPGFGAVLTVFAIAGLLVAAYLVMRRRE